MTWISLVCLLALAGSAFGRSAYGGGYGSSPIPQMPTVLNSMRDIQRPVLPTLPVSDYSGSIVSETPKLLNNYGSFVQKSLPVQGYGGMSRFLKFDQQPELIPQAPVLTPADLLCRGQQAETVIPLEDGRKFVVCLDESKGVEQQCPSKLFYHPTSRRCERRLGPLENVCASQPCLNGGECIPTDSSYQCRCAAGFDGHTCELDARVCQTQYPCGQSSDVKCQSFRLGAALQYICILQDGVAYGLSAQQPVPSPCRDVDGPHGLSVSNKGFIMCDGERMFVESCPGGTIWDDLNKACVWPDMQGAVSQFDQPSYGSSYGETRQIIPQSTYGSQIRVLEQPKLTHSYGNQMRVHHHRHEQPRLLDSYGSQIPITKPSFEQPRLFESYGSQIPLTKPSFEQPRLSESYGSQIPLTKPVLEQPKFFQTPVDSYGSKMTIDKPVVLGEQRIETPVDSYGSQIPIEKPIIEEPKLIQPPVQSYGARTIQKPVVFEQPKLIRTPVQSYGSQFSFEQPKLIKSSGY